MNVNGKTFVVTGAGGGIGGELVLALLRREAKVAAVDLRNDGLQELRHRAGSNASSLTAHVLDITQRPEVGQLPGAVIAAHGEVDGLINCAGIIQPFLRVNDLDYNAIEHVMNVNFFGTLYMTKAFLPYLLKRPEAYLVNVSSMGGFLPVPGQSVYGASKAAVKLLTEGLYAELLDTPVRVMVVFPGATDTNIAQNSQVKAPRGVNVDTVKLQAQMLSADKAAAMILDGIEKNKTQVFTGNDSNLMNLLYRLNPVFATRLIAKQMKLLLS